MLDWFLWRASYARATQIRDTYSFVLDVSPLYQSKTYNIDQEIRVVMPSQTDVTGASPSDKATTKGNLATFVIHTGDRYPSSYQVNSAPALKDVPQRLVESANRWMTDPSGWVALGTALMLTYGAFRGSRLMRRRGTYYRLYRSMVSVYDRFSSDPESLDKEMGSLFHTVLRFFVENKITDEQFEKLMKQRDYLLASAGRPPRTQLP